MSTQYGEHCMAHKNVYKWVDRFKCGRTTPDDEELSCWLSTPQTDDHCAEMAALIKEIRLLYVIFH